MNYKFPLDLSLTLAWHTLPQRSAHAYDFTYDTLEGSKPQFCQNCMLKVMKNWKSSGKNRTFFAKQQKNREVGWNLVIFLLMLDNYGTIFEKF